MMQKLERVLKRQGGFYTFNDIMDCIAAGTMQSFADGDTWVVTQVHEFPRKKVLDIAFVIGDVDALHRLEPVLEEFAREIGAEMMMATGRLGWEKKYFPGWRRVSTNFVRDV